MNYWELCRLFAPEITLVLTAGLVLLLDLARGRGMPNRQRMGLAAALAGVYAALLRQKLKPQIKAQA